MLGVTIVILFYVVNIINLPMKVDIKYAEQQCGGILMPSCYMLIPCGLDSYVIQMIWLRVHWKRCTETIFKLL